MNSSIRRAVLAIATLAISFFAVAHFSDNTVHGQTGCTLATAKRDIQDYYGNRASGPNHILGGFYMNQVKMRNTSSHCHYNVGVATYKAYEFYTINVKSQEYFNHKSYNIPPGGRWETTISVPNCNYQIDVYYGSLLRNFNTTTYGDSGRLLDAWFFPGDQAQRDTNRPYCTKPTIVPTQKPTPTPAKRATPTPVLASCPAGTTWVDKNKNGRVDSNECERPSISICPSGTIWVDKNNNGRVDNAECERPVTSTCPTGTVWVDLNKNKQVDNGECQRAVTTICPTGSIWVDRNDNKKVDVDECETPITATCPEGSIWVDKNEDNIVDPEECETPIITVCPAGAVWVDQNENNVVDEGECQEPVMPVCPAGTVWVDKNENGQADPDECQLPQPSPTPVRTTPEPSVLSDIGELPSTGPGAAVVVSMFGLVGGLMARKHNMFDRFQQRPTRKKTSDKA